MPPSEGILPAEPKVMTHDPVFDSNQNQALLAVCARKTIRRAAVGAIIWGVINLAIGYFAAQVNPINAGILLLGVIMVGTGVSALRQPTLHSLLAEGIVSLLILGWNVGIGAVNARLGHSQSMGAHGLIFPLIAAIAFFRQYSRLGHLKDAIGALDYTTVKEASTLCQQLFKSKLKHCSDVVQASSKRWRARLLPDSIFCAQRNLGLAFQMNRDEFSRCVRDLGQKRLRVVVRHPLGKLSYGFDRKNSDKIKTWLGISATTQA